MKGGDLKVCVCVWGESYVKCGDLKVWGKLRLRECGACGLMMYCVFPGLP